MKRAVSESKESETVFFLPSLYCEGIHIKQGEPYAASKKEKNGGKFLSGI